MPLPVSPFGLAGLAAEVTGTPILRGTRRRGCPSKGPNRGRREGLATSLGSPAPPFTFAPPLPMVNDPHPMGQRRDRCALNAVRARLVLRSVVSGPPAEAVARPARDPRRGYLLVGGPTRTPGRLPAAAVVRCGTHQGLALPLSQAYGADPTSVPGRPGPDPCGPAGNGHRPPPTHVRAAAVHGRQRAIAPPPRSPCRRRLRDLVKGRRRRRDLVKVGTDGVFDHLQPLVGMTDVEPLEILAGTAHRVEKGRDPEIGLAVARDLADELDQEVQERPGWGGTRTHARLAQRSRGRVGVAG